MGHVDRVVEEGCEYGESRRRRRRVMLECGGGGACLKVVRLVGVTAQMVEVMKVMVSITLLCNAEDGK